MTEHLVETAALSQFISLRTLVLSDEILISIGPSSSLRSPSICSSLLPSLTAPSLREITLVMVLEPYPAHGFSTLPSLSYWEMIDSALSDPLRLPSLRRVTLKLGVQEFHYTVAHIRLDLDDEAPPSPGSVTCPTWEEAAAILVECLPRLAARNCLRFEKSR